jgi:hypothetical protein
MSLSLVWDMCVLGTRQPCVVTRLLESRRPSTRHEKTCPSVPFVVTSSQAWDSMQAVRLDPFSNMITPERRLFGLGHTNCCGRGDYGVMSPSPCHAILVELMWALCGMRNMTQVWF